VHTVQFKDKVVFLSYFILLLYAYIESLDKRYIFFRLPPLEGDRGGGQTQEQGQRGGRIIDSYEKIANKMDVTVLPLNPPPKGET